MKIYIRDPKQNLIGLMNHYVQHDDADIQCGDIFSVTADAIVSPANSFGFMDGGIDFLYTKIMGPQVQERVQTKIQEKFNGELLVGNALSVRTDYERFPMLISAPTMRVPSIILDCTAVYLATRAAVQEGLRRKISSLAMPGMGTGSGRVDPRIASKMMASGIADAFEPKPFPKSWREAFERMAA